VTHLVATIAAAVGVFVGSNIDDLIVLIVLFLGVRTGNPPALRIVAGQYLGFGILVVASIAIALGLTAVPQRWVGLVGLVPLGIGVWGLIGALREGPAHSPVVATRLWSIAGICLANGMDGISVYAPLLRTNSPADDVVIVLVMLACVGVWCALASWLGGRHRIIALLRRIGFWLVPVVFIAIGAVVIVGSGLLD
jgi:cadmium resistance protein CadD (predicted permease)